MNCVHCSCRESYCRKKAAGKRIDLHHSNLVPVRQLMLRAEADRLRNNFAAYKKSREEVILTAMRPNEAIRYHR